MTLNEYQKLARHTDKHHPLAYYILEICNEAGELASPLKKHIFRDKPLDREHVLSEMGDVLWPLALLAHHLGFTLEEVARENIAKLEARHPPPLPIRIKSADLLPEIEPGCVNCGQQPFGCSC